MRVQRKILFTVMVLGFLAMMGACNSTEKDELAENKTDVDEPAALEGSVVLDGSGTVYPLMATLAEMYMEKEDKVSVEVSRSGTGAGFGKFLVEDGTDFNN